MRHDQKEKGGGLSKVSGGGEKKPYHGHRPKGPLNREGGNKNGTGCNRSPENLVAEKVKGCAQNEVVKSPGTVGKGQHAKNAKPTGIQGVQNVWENLLLGGGEVPRGQGV